MYFLTFEIKSNSFPQLVYSENESALVALYLELKKSKATISLAIKRIVSSSVVIVAKDTDSDKPHKKILYLWPPENHIHDIAFQCKQCNHKRTGQELINHFEGVAGGSITFEEIQQRIKYQRITSHCRASSGPWPSCVKFLRCMPCKLAGYNGVMEPLSVY